MKLRTLVIGDIHGNYKGLKQALERSNFDYENDTLITLGDICDGYSQVYECVEELLKIKNRIDIIGNHDEPFLEFIETGFHSWNWAQGGDGTLRSYGKSCLGENFKHQKTTKWITNLNPGDIPESHKEFFRHQISYYIDDNNRCFIHGGFNRHFPIKEQHPFAFCWDRDLWMSALSFKAMNSQEYSFKIKDNFSEIFIGHTSTINWGTDQPMNAINIWNLDTGGGWKTGKITIMNVNTHEFFQSDLAGDLYPNEQGR